MRHATQSNAYSNGPKASIQNALQRMYRWKEWAGGFTACMNVISITHKPSDKGKKPTALPNGNGIRRILGFMLPAVLGCSSPEMHTAAPEAGRPDTVSVARIDHAVAVSCDLRYDTILNEKYQMHCRILQKQAEAKKYAGQTDARNSSGRHFLYPQDIAEFAARLDPSETGVYKQLTNKVVFVILEHEAALLDPGLNTLDHSPVLLDYFMHHVSHPICNAVAVDTTMRKVNAEMKASGGRAVQLKKRLLESLSAAAG
jgi:hypothetical protein